MSIPDSRVSILAVRRGGLGDLLVVLPSLRLIRSAFPEARIGLIARPAYGRLFLDAGVVDSVEDAEDFRWAALADSASRVGTGDLPLPQADAVLGWFHSKAGGVFRERAAALWPEAAVRSFVSDPAVGRPLNRALFNLTAEFVANRFRPIVKFEESAFLPFSPRESDRGADRSTFGPPAGRLIVIHPGGGGRSKLWPVDRFFEISEFLSGRGFGGVIVTGEAEERMEADLSGRALPPGWFRMVRPPLAGLTALLARSAFYLGNDSGVTHLAAVLRVPGLAVFRSEFVPAWNPGGKITVVSAADVGDITTASVRDRLLSAGLTGA